LWGRRQWAKSLGDRFAVWHLDVRLARFAAAAGKADKG
jgi:hypothetical protein